uniref:Uncharacterized protein n=1 Tax=Octopus bimaculoides TaxID=37653 RepID=A0A0L8I7D9_OCTBM
MPVLLDIVVLCGVCVVGDFGLAFVFSSLVFVFFVVVLGIGVGLSFDVGGSVVSLIGFGVGVNCGGVVSFLGLLC